MEGPSDTATQSEHIEGAIIYCMTPNKYVLTTEDGEMQAWMNGDKTIYYSNCGELTHKMLARNT